MLDSFFSNHLWVLAFLPGVLLALFGHWRFSQAYRRCSIIPTVGKVTGVRAARTLLDRNGMANVELYEMTQSLGAHHDPRRRCVFLSPTVINGRSVANVAVAAHVVAHAIQLKREHRFYRLRMLVLSVTGKITMLAVILVGLGLVTNVGTSRILLSLAAGGYLLFVFAHLITLKVEYNASRLARGELLRHGLMAEGERSAFTRMLSAAVFMETPTLLFAFLGPFRRFLGSRKDEDD